MSLLIFSVCGCWSYPTNHGSWSGSVTPKSIYVADKQLEGVIFKSADGSELAPNIRAAYLVDEKKHVIDASSIPSNAVVKVWGTAGFMVVKDVNGESANVIKGRKGVEVSAIQVESITVNGERVEPIILDGSK